MKSKARISGYVNNIRQYRDIKMDKAMIIFVCHFISPIFDF